MTQKKKRIFQGTTSNLKPGTYEAMLRRARMQKGIILAEKVDAFASELKAEGVSFFIFTDISNNCKIKVDCTEEQFDDMLAEFSSRLHYPLASTLGRQFVAHGLALLKYHDKEAFDIVKRNIAEL